MAPAVRALPLRRDPVPGEALDSWLEALCHRLDCTWGDFIGPVGLPPSPPRGDRTPAWLVRLTPTLAATLHAATGTPIPTLHAMTLASLDGTALRLKPGTCAVDRTFPWSRWRYSRFCPDCLRDNGGRWQLFWRCGWAFACLEHRCLLVDQCPACGHRMRGHVPITGIVPDGQRCPNPEPHALGSNPARCDADLTAAPTLRMHAGHPTLTAQHLVGQVIESRTATFGLYYDHPTPVAAALADLRVLAGRILATATADDWRTVLPADLAAAYACEQQAGRGSGAGRRIKPGQAAPNHAVTAAAGVTAAVPILDLPDVGAVAHGLEWLVDSNRARGLKVSRASVATWGRVGTELLCSAQLIACGTYESPNAELHYRAGTLMPTRPAHDLHNVAALATTLPALLWPAFALRMTPPDPLFEHMSAGLAAATLLVNSQLTYGEANALLGNPVNPTTLTHIIRVLHHDPCWNDIRRALIAVAEYLHTHPGPINYERRRTLDYTALLPTSSWHDIQQVARVHDRRHALPLARSYLYTVLSGNPAHRAPSHLDEPWFIASLAVYPSRLTPALAAALHGEAQEFLRRNEIDEPLTWQPPLDLLDGLVLPGADPDAINIPTLHHLMRCQQRRSIGALARALHTTPEAVAHVLTLHPAPAKPLKTRLTMLALADRVSQEEFKALYDERSITLRDIASRYDAKLKTVTDLAYHYGIDTRNTPRWHDEIDRDWLYTEYIVHRRTLGDLAAEKATNPTTVARWARRHGIALRPEGWASTAAHLADTADVDRAPTLLQPALHQVGGAERLRRFARIVDYPHVTAAAADLGYKQSALVCQLARLERDFGGALLNRAKRGQPMTLTTLGEQVLRAWTAWEHST